MSLSGQCSVITDYNQYLFHHCKKHSIIASSGTSFNHLSFLLFASSDVLFSFQEIETFASFIIEVLQELHMHFKFLLTACDVINEKRNAVSPTDQTLYFS